MTEPTDDTPPDDSSDDPVDTPPSETTPTSNSDNVSQTTDPDGTIVYTYPDGTIRRQSITPATQVFPSLTITIQTATFDELKNELSDLVSKIGMLDGNSAAVFSTIFPGGGNSSANYQLN